MRRRGDSELVPNEVKLLVAAIAVTTQGEPEFHGYALAKELAVLEGTAIPMSQSTLYRALRRLEARGALESRWESTEEVTEAGRDGPPRRYYTVTAGGLAEARAVAGRADRAGTVPSWIEWVPNLQRG
jgi:DNA-binding PadR family transcriptional regulator